MFMRAMIKMAPGILLLLLAPSAWAAPEFNPYVGCKSQDIIDKGPYPWEFRTIVEGYINRNFYDPRSVIDLEIYKPAPGWWTTAKFKMTTRNTKCYWYIPFVANGKNRMGGYVGRKAYGLWVKNGSAVYYAERTGVDRRVIEDGERHFSEELNKLSTDEQEKVLALASPDSGQQERETPAYLQELKELAKLRDAGIITEEEFQQKKTEILGLEKHGDSGESREESP